MRKLITFGAAVALLAVPSTALAHNGKPTQADKTNAARTCKALRTEMGVATFRTTYGTNVNDRNAFGKCVSQMAREEHADRHNAAQECRAEREADPAAFKAKYGTNANKSNAFGKCVSGKQRAERAEDREQILNAAKLCKAERAADPEAFKTKYGTNRNKSNAFG